MNKTLIYVCMGRGSRRFKGRINACAKLGGDGQKDLSNAGLCL